MNENSENTLIPNEPNYSFRYSYSCLPRNKQREFREKIQKLIGTTTTKSVYDRIYGLIEPKVSEAKAIEQIFKSYGIKVEWGKPLES